MIVRTVALDVHKHFSEVAEFKDGRVSLKGRIPTEPFSLKKFASSLGSTDRVVLESCTNTWAIASLLRPHAGELLISNPLKTRMIAEAKIKTDKVDASTLAILGETGFLPTVWFPDEKTLEIRRRTSYRSALVRQAVQIKNRIHSILHRNLISYMGHDLFSTAGRKFLRALTLPPDEQFQLESDFFLLETLEARIQACEKHLAPHAFADKKAHLLMSINGIDFGTALGITGALGTIERFSEPRKLVSYLGLNPIIHQTGLHSYSGPISKQGSSHVRWLLVEAAYGAIRSPGTLRAFYLRLRARKGNNVAIVAVARKLAVIIWHILTKGEPYWYSLPQRTQEKLRKLRLLATGQRKKGGLPKGSKRPPTYGTGESSRKKRRHEEIARLREAERDYRRFLAERFGIRTAS